jgi:drug/metabolite transporter (DMT)-like permease
MLCASLIWGATFAVVHRALEEMPVFHLLAFRFLLGTLALAPWLVQGLRDRRLWPHGLRLGGLLFVAFALQTGALARTTPTRAAFLTALSVILVPFMARLWPGHPLRPATLAGSALAAGGLWVLYRPGAGSVAGFALGDWLALACAVAFAAHILVVDHAARRGPARPLAALQFAVVALLAAPSLLLAPPAWTELTGDALVAILVTGLLATALAFTLQLHAQQTLSAAEVAVLLALEPVFAALFSVLLGTEPWKLATGLGGLLIVAGTVLVQVRRRTGPVAGLPEH